MKLKLYSPVFFFLLSFFPTYGYADYSSAITEADFVHGAGKTKEAYNLYKQAYKQAITREQLIQSFAALATTSNELGYKKSSGAYIDRLRSVSPKNEWASNFVKENSIVIPGAILALHNETYTDLMLSGDQSYSLNKFKSAYVYYLKALSMASTREQLVVSLASLSVTSHKNGKDPEAIIYLKRLNYVSPENQWAINYANEIGAKNTTELSQREYDTLISSSDRRLISQHGGSSKCSKKPILACSPEEAKSVAFAMCASVMGGCELAQKDLDTNQHYLADQACNGLVNEMTDQKHNLDSILTTFVGTTLSEGAKSARSSEDGFTKFIFGTVLTIMDLGFKASVLDQCMSAARQSCRTTYNNWKYSCG